MIQDRGLYLLFVFVISIFGTTPTAQGKESLKSHTVQELVNQYKTDDVKVHRLIDSKLVELASRDSHTIGWIIRGLADADGDVRYGCARVLGRMPAPSAEVIRALSSLVIRTKDEGERAIAANSLGRLGTRGGDALGELLLKNADALVRREAARALGLTGAPAVALLLKGMKDQDEAVRHEAVISLATIGSPVVSAVKSRIDKEQSLKAKSDLAEVLIRVGEGEGRAALGALFDGLQSRNEQIRVGAARVLVEAKQDTGTHEILKNEINENEIGIMIGCLTDVNAEIREITAEALSFVGPRAKKAVPALILLLEDSSEYVRGFAAQALGTMGRAGRPAVKTLAMLAVRESSDEVRIYAVGALTQLGPEAKEAIPVLRKGLQSRNLSATGKKIVQGALKQIESASPGR